MTSNSQEACPDVQFEHLNYPFLESGGSDSSERQSQLIAHTEAADKPVIQSNVRSPPHKSKKKDDNNKNYPISQSRLRDKALVHSDDTAISKDQEYEASTHHDTFDPNDTSGSWSIGEFTQEETSGIARHQNYRDYRLFSQIADAQIDIDDGSSVYSSVLGDLSPRLNPDDLYIGCDNENEIESENLESQVRPPIEHDDLHVIEKKRKASTSGYHLVVASKAIYKPPTFLIPKPNEISFGNSDEHGKSELSKRRQRKGGNELDGEYITLQENGLAMRAKKLVDAETQAHSHWDTEVRGYMAQLGSISYLGPVYPNTELFRIVELFDDNGLIHTRCIRVAEPPEELVWTQVSAADHQSQYRSQAIWSPTEVDSFNEDELQLIFFSFANSSLSLDMQERFHQSRMVRIWPPWHEHLLQLEDGSVTTVKLVTRFITDTIY